MSTLIDRMAAALRAVDAMRRCPIVDDDFPMLRDRADLQVADVLRELDAGAMLNIARHDVIVEAILSEEQCATAKFPTWPTDPLHALAVVHEEVGELAKDVLQLVYEPHKTNASAVAIEAIQAGAMLIRFARSLDRYEYTPGPQHVQGPSR